MVFSFGWIYTEVTLPFPFHRMCLLSLFFTPQLVFDIWCYKVFVVFSLCSCVCECVWVSVCVKVVSDSNYSYFFFSVCVEGVRLDCFCCLVVWVLWHIYLWRLFDAKSSFMKIVLVQTILFRISMQFKCKYSLIVKNISISSYSVYSNSSNSANSG